MPKIHVLDKHTAELIAAGEVVERPSSVVKELMENAIDAGASVISVEIENGGVSLIRVSDNGSGIERDDVEKAFLRHATSKVHTKDDLDAIGTLGFRGEALASVCAVSRVELLTCAAGRITGTRYINEGGVGVLLEDAARPQGTTIVVRDLFYNVPARMKFLKKDVTEANAVAGVADRIALSHPEISVRFVRDGREELLTPGDGQLLSCIYTVLGKDFAKALKKVDYKLDGIHVHGYVSSPEACRANRTMQHTFINNRYVKSSTVTAALEQAFKGLVMTGKFPCCVLFVDMPLSTVDVNVHPAKIEVRFINERSVFGAVYHGVKSSLQSDGAPAAMQMPPFKAKEPEIKPEQTHFNTNTARQTAEKIARQSPPDGTDWSPVDWARDTKPKSFTGNQSLTFNDGGIAPYNRPVFVPDIVCDSLPQQAEEESKDNNAEPQKEYEPDEVSFIGEAFSAYIIAQKGDSLYLIDKHAAHERILYNKFKSEEDNHVQLLLQPVTVTLSREEYSAVVSELDSLRDAGFEVEEFGGNSVIVRAVPMMLDGCDIADIIREISGAFVSGRFDGSISKLDRIYHFAACRAAVKAGDMNKPEELKAVAERVLSDGDIRTCPHGRPVCFEITKKHIEKQFGRTK